MTFIPEATPKEKLLKKKRIELLTNKVQPNFEKELNKMGVYVEPIISDEKTLDSYFIVRLPDKGRPDDALLLEIKNKIFSSGRFLLSTLGPYSFKVSIALASLEDAFKFTPLSIHSPVSSESAEKITPVKSEKVENKILVSNPKPQTEMETNSKNMNLREKVKKFLEACGFTTKKYQNILPAKKGKAFTVNCIEVKFAQELYENRSHFSKEDVVFMKPGAKAVHFFETPPL